MQIKEAKQHIEIFEMALRSKQCLGEQELEEYKLCQSIDTVINELEKKEKVIDLMAEELRYYNGMQQYAEFCIDTCGEKEECDKENCKNRIIERFEKKVSDNK